MDRKRRGRVRHDPAPARQERLSEKDAVVFGRVVKPHGLDGEVTVEILTDFPERFRPGTQLLLKDNAGNLRPARLVEARPHGGRMLVLFEGSSGLDDAEAFRGFELCALPGDVPERPEGYVFHWEVESCDAVDKDGRKLGKIKELADSGGRPLLVVETPRGPRDVPFTWPIVVNVDLKKNIIVLDPPAGLLD